ncbi:MAG: DUF5777 family beta-barrel protein [Chitinophagia bacterium]
MFIRSLSLGVLIVLMLSIQATAQTVDLFSENNYSSNPDIITGTFKSTRIVNGQSIENVGPGILDFSILHRFGALSQGAYNFYGLDQATMRLGLDYGITDRLMIGIGRSTFEKQYDGFLKLKIIRQQQGERNIPFSLSYTSSLIYKSLKDAVTTYIPYVSDKFSFSHQLLLASKINDYFSLQLSPTLLHYNMVDSKTIPNDFYSLGIGFRQRVSKRVNITTEYYHRFNTLEGYNDPLSVGVDIETGGHVFQLHVSNSTGMTDRTFINETAGSWAKGDLRFGFNISRVFTIRKPKELRDIKW